METTFFSGGSKLAARIHAPAGAGAGRKPGILVMGSWLTVKEQMPERYAPLLADAGFVSMTFDFRGFGASEGAPREVESARAKAETILDAAAYLRTRPEVDPTRVGVLAICASASYTALALQGADAGGLVQSVVMAAPWIHDRALVEQIYGGAAAVRERLAKAEAARVRYAATGEVEYVRAASNVDATAAMYWEGNALDYYLNPARGAVPEWGGRFATVAWTEWLESDFVALGRRFFLPLRIVSSRGSATPAGVEKLVAELPSPAEVVWTEGSQFDFYDEPATVRFTVDRAVEHFRRTLA